MPEITAAWIGVAGTLLGAVLGWGLSEIPRRRGERQARLARLHAVRVEVEHCGELLRTFRQARIMAPLYRLPTWAGVHALGAIATDGTLGDAAVQSLLRYYTQVEEFNRGLDRAGAAHAAHDDGGLRKEYDRLVLKAPQLLDPDAPGGLSLQERVERALRGAIEATTRRRLFRGRSA